MINPVPVRSGIKREKTNSSGLLHHAGKKGEITLQELGQRITAVCGIPVIITPDAANSTLEGGATRQMTGTLPAPDENGRLPLSSLGSTTMTTSTQPLTLNNLMWQGDINGLLDLMASRSGLYWRMDNGRIVFYLTETRTYPLHMLNTKPAAVPVSALAQQAQWGQQEARITQHPVMQRPLRAQPLVRNTICMKTSGKLLKQC